MFKDVNRSELLKVFLVSILAIIVINAPYMMGYLNNTTEVKYSGIRLNNYPDTNSYLAWINQAGEGKMFLKQLYSHTAQNEVFFNPVFSFAGAFVYADLLTPIGAYHFVRILGSQLFLIIGYLLIAHFFKEREERLIVFIVFVFGAGVGWLFGIGGDLNQIEATNFLNLYEPILNSYALSCMLLTSLIFLKRDQFSFWSQLLWSTIFLNLLILIHPYEIITIFIILALYASFEYRQKRDTSAMRLLGYSILTAFPAIIWQAWVLVKNPDLAVWLNVQSNFFNINLWIILLGLGLTGILALIGAFLVCVEKDSKKAFLVIWGASTLAILMNPFYDRFQKKLSVGMFIPITILAGFAIVNLLKDFKAKRVFKNLFVGIIFIILSFTNFVLIFGDISYYKNLPHPIYEKVDYIEGLNWIAGNTNEDDIFLAGNLSGNRIPAFVNRQVYYGHYDQTVNAGIKAELSVKILTSGVINNDPLKYLVELEGIDYIFVDEDIRALGGVSASDRKYLKLVFENKDVQIYKVE